MSVPASPAVTAVTVLKKKDKPMKAGTAVLIAMLAITVA
jgi:hypothetical protein